MGENCNCFHKGQNNLFIKATSTTGRLRREEKDLSLVRMSLNPGYILLIQANTTTSWSEVVLMENIIL